MITVVPLNINQSLRNANEYLVGYAGSFIYRDGLRNSSRFACLLGDRDNTGLLIGHIGKYFHELLQTLVNWDENLKTNTYKDLLFLLCRLFVGILAWMGTSDMPDAEFGFDLLDS